MDLNVKLQPGDGQKLREDLNQNFTLLQYEDEKDDSALQEEEDARRNADSREIQARQAEDNNLQSQVDALRRRLDTDEKNIADLQTRMKTAEEQIKQLNETVYGIPPAILNEASSVDDEENDNQPLQEINTERNGILDAQ